jgi:hypothetical protein
MARRTRCSSLSALAGSSAAARRAASHDDRPAISRNSSTISACVAGSVACRPTSIAVINRVSPNAATRPLATQSRSGGSFGSRLVERLGPFPLLAPCEHQSRPCDAARWPPALHRAPIQPALRRRSQTPRQRVRVLRTSGDLKGQQAVRIPPGIDSLWFDEAAEHQSRSHQQHE